VEKERCTRQKYISVATECGELCALLCSKLWSGRGAFCCPEMTKYEIRESVFMINHNRIDGGDRLKNVQNRVKRDH
jgi:hypothetical protein